MARKRMIDPDFWTDEKLGKCCRDERLFFAGLISNADDEGRGRASSKLLKSSIFPYDEDLQGKDIENMLINLAKHKLVILYKVDEQEFYFLPNFLKHQNINRSSPSKLPEPTEDSIVKQFSEYSVSIHGVLTPKRKEKNIKEYNVHSVNEFFESIWKLYPEKKGKGQINNSQKEKLFKIGIDKLTLCIERYKKSKPDWQAWQNGSTFFNSGYIDYLDNNQQCVEIKTGDIEKPAESDLGFLEYCKALDEQEKQQKGGQ